MPIYLNGVKYNKVFLYGKEYRGFIGGKPIFTSTPIPTGTLIVKCVDGFSNKQVRPTQVITVPAGNHLSLMNFVHQGKLTVINNKEWFNNDDNGDNHFNDYDFPLKPGQTLTLKPSFSSL